jgi:hypothetical protein
MQISNLMKIRPLGAEMLHSDMTNLIVALCNFANAPKKNRMAAILLLRSTRTKNIMMLCIFIFNIRCQTLKLRSCVRHVNAIDP